MLIVCVAAIVNMGFNVSFEQDGFTVAAANVMLGGATSRIISAKATAASLVGNRLDNATLSAATAALVSIIRATPSTDKINSQEYRESLACGFLYKYFLDAQSQLPSSFQSALIPFTPADARPVSSGSVSYGTDPKEAPLGEWIIKTEAAMQATGEARYVSDMNVGAWFGQIVLSTTCNAKLSSVDPSAALKMPGVKAFISASDIPAGGHNFYAGDLVMLPGGDLAKDKLFWEVGDVSDLFSAHPLQRTSHHSLSCACGCSNFSPLPCARTHFCCNQPQQCLLHTPCSPLH